MTESNDFFPFPVSEGENQQQTSSAETSLPAFPEIASADAQTSLDASEIRDLKKIIDLYRQGKLIKTEKSSETVAEKMPVEQASAAIIPAPVINPLPQAIDEVLSAFFVSDSIEQEAKSAFKAILNEISDQRTRMRAFSALCGIFPAKKCLRHGTPEQRLFALTVLGDRYLESMAGLQFNERRKLLKAVARYLSQISDGFNFIQMEGEAFSSQYHERVAGASAGGKTIREMHGFLIVGRDNNQVIRIGLVLT